MLLLSRALYILEAGLRKSVINSFVRLAVERRKWIYLSWGLIFALSVAVLATNGLTVDTSRRGLVSEDNPDSARYHNFLREFGTPLYLVVVIEGDDPATNKKYATELADTLRQNRSQIGEVVSKMSFDAFRPFGLLWASPDSLQSMQRLLKALADTSEGGPQDKEIAGINGAVSDLHGVLTALPDHKNRLSKMEMALKEGSSEESEELSPEELTETVRDLFVYIRQSLSEDDWTEVRPLLDVSNQMEEGVEGEVGFQPLRASGIDSQGFFASEDGTQILLFVKPASDSEQIEVVDPYVQFVEDTAEGMLPDGVQVYVTGNQAHVATEMRYMRRDMALTAVIAVVGILLLFFFTYGSFLHTSVVAAPLMVGVPATLAFTSLVFGRINLLSSALLAILVGLGVDFGIHFLSRFREAMREDLSSEEAVSEMLHKAGPGVITGALTTMAAFLAMATSDFTGMKELGVISAVGLFIVLIANLTLLPCLFIKMGGKLQGVRSPLRSVREGRGRISSALLQEPLLILVLTVAATIYLASAIKPIAFSFSVTQFIPAESSAAMGYQKLREQDGFNPDFAVMVADSAEEARELAESLMERDDLIARVLSTATYLPAGQDEKGPIVKDIKDHVKSLGTIQFQVDGEPDPKEFVKALESLIESQDEDEFEAPLDPLGGALSELLLEGGRAEEIAVLAVAGDEIRKTIALIQSLEPEVARRRLNNLEDRVGGTINDLQSFLKRDSLVMSPSDLPADLRQNHWHPTEGGEGRFVLHVFPRGSIEDPAFMEEFNAFAKTIDPDVTGLPVTFIEFGNLLRLGLEKSALYAVIIIFIILLIDFRSLTGVLMALFPLLLGAVWMVGCMNVFGIGYNFANMMAIPLILGIGIDSGVHIVHRYRQGTLPGELVSTTGKAVFISSFTTMIGFGSMMAASYGGMRSLGMTLVIGVGACLISTTTVLPAWLEFLHRSRGGTDRPEA